MALFDKQRVASQWETLEVSKLLSDGARNIEAGTATDAGRMWHLPTSHPDPIVLAGGIPDERVLPTTALVDAFSKALSENSADALMYGGWFGYEGCRKAIAERQNSLEGTSLQPSNIIMHNGSSGCLENVLRAFVQPRDVVIVESPSYSGTVRAIQGFQSDVVEIPMGPSGVDPDLFRQTVENLKGKGRRVKLFYTIPDYHNPTGTVTESNIRQSILETCASNEIIIAEDAAYTEIYFKGSAPPSSYYALSDGHGVITVVQASVGALRPCTQEAFDAVAVVVESLGRDDEGGRRRGLEAFRRDVDQIDTGRPHPNEVHDRSSDSMDIAALERFGENRRALAQHDGIDRRWVQAELVEDDRYRGEVTVGHETNGSAN